MQATEAGTSVACSHGALPILRPDAFFVGAVVSVPPLRGFSARFSASELDSLHTAERNALSAGLVLLLLPARPPRSSAQLLAATLPTRSPGMFKLASGQ